MTKHLITLLILLTTNALFSANPKQTAQPSCPKEPCKETPFCRYPNSNELKINGLVVKATNPKKCKLGDEYLLEIEIVACEDVCDVVVNAQLPKGAVCIRSAPEAKVEGNMLTWDIGPMKSGQCIPSQVWIKTECEGEICACFCAKANPVRFCSILCEAARLVCQKCGPARACPGDLVTYRVTITNQGNCTAENVILTDTLPEGLEHSSGQRELCYNFGNLAPCESKCVDICLTAVKRGNVCNRAVVTACNADTACCKACTCICCCGVKITKEGPREHNVGKHADYVITVTNTGDIPLTDLIVTDSAASATSIVSANGATIRGTQAVWKIKEIPVGEHLVLNVKLVTCTPGTYTNNATVSTCEGCNDKVELTTRWKGRPALHLTINDTVNPICLQDPTTYQIQITNQGPEPDSNIKMVVCFPKEMEPVAINGDLKGAIKDQTVTFQPAATLWPKQSFNVKIDARAKQSGEGRVVVELSSDSTPIPIIQQQSTQVY